MTIPHSEGDAFIDVHANTDPYERELDRQIRVASEDAEKLLKVTGQSWGKTLSKSTGESFGNQITSDVKRNFNRRGRSIVRTMEREIVDEFQQLTRPNGVFSRIGQGISDAIGAGFNVSGKSPLIAVLAPLIGAIIALVAAAIQAVNGLLALLAAAPALIASVGIQVGVLMIAFQGMGSAIQGAFAATNTKELLEAIKDLTPSAQKFVLALLPLKQLFADIKTLTQESFFRALGTGPITDLVKNLRPLLTHGFNDVAFSLGFFFRELANFFNSKVFLDFVAHVFPATTRWITVSGPAFINLLRALVGMADHVLPFLERFGEMFANNLNLLANFLLQAVNSGKFNAWLDSMETTLSAVVELIAQVLSFIAAFLVQLDSAGGRQLIEKLAEAFSILATFIMSPVGQKAMEGLVDILIFAIESTTGLIIALMSLLAILELAGESIHQFFMFITDVLGPAVGGFFADFYNGAVRIAKATIDVFKKLFTAFRTTFTETKQTIENFFSGLIGNIFNLGRNVVSSLINGIRSKFNDLKNTVLNIADIITSYLPGSPAETGPLSGSGYSLLRGQRMMQDFAKGIGMEIPNLRNVSLDAVSQITFGKGAIQVNGEFATPAQAEKTGASIGTGINAILASRQTQLAVRTL